jgi:hypothetical protein
MNDRQEKISLALMRPLPEIEMLKQERPEIYGPCEAEIDRMTRAMHELAARLDEAERRRTH